MLLAAACALLLYGPVTLADTAPATAVASSLSAPSASVPPAWPGGAPEWVAPMRAWGSVLFCLMALAAAAWVWRRAHGPRSGDSPERIDVLAARSFGPKHRVALIETCGERLLLALCDKEITVLSHLPGPSLSETSLSETPPAASERRFEVVP